MRRVGRTGRVAGHSLAAGVAVHRSRADAVHTVAGAGQAVGRESGHGLRHSPGRTGPGERRSRVAGERRHTGHAQVLGTGSIMV